MSDYFSTFALKPNTECADTECRKRQEEAKGRETRLSKRSERVKAREAKDEKPVESANEWGITMEEEVGEEGEKKEKEVEVTESL